MSIFKIFKRKSGNKQTSQGDAAAKNNQKDYINNDNMRATKETDTHSSQILAGAGSLNLKEALKGVDRSKLSFKERAALKIFEKMPQKKQESILQQAMNPQTIMNMKPEDRAKIKKQLDDAVRMGMIPKGQAEAMKSRMGLR